MADCPTMPEVLERVMTARSERVRTWFPGEVVSYSASSKAARVRPLVRLSGGRELPVMPNVRVSFPGGVYWDVQAGETGIVLVGWMDWRGWRRSGEVSAPEDEGLHELDYAIFLPGLWDDSTATTTVSPAGAKVIDSGDLRLGAALATKAALHEDLLLGLNALLAAWASFAANFDVWAAAVGVVTGITWTGQPVQTTYAALQAQISNMQTQIAAGTYQSPSVKVED